MTKEQAKEEIKHLINRYELQKSRHLLKDYNEAMTRKDFILPLFKALGWDVFNENNQEFIEEERAIQGRIDYVCQIDNSPKLYLEIKALKVDLEKEEWAKQVISYAYHKGISWAVLSDFEGIKVFNAEWEVATPEQCKFFELKSNEYLEKFDKLWLLSREACSQNLLDEKALEWGKKPKRAPINELLASDLVKWHDKLKTVFKAYNTISDETLEEAIQRFLDRLIFIRTLEDRGIEQKYLWRTIQKWESKNRKPDLLIEDLRALFRDYDKWYNSKLFRPHTCDALKVDESYFEEIISDLYREKGISSIPYTFDKINADVLGSIYEQYLGEIQKGETKNLKRKKQGIYYTPTYIVEYIVNNTLGMFLKEKSIREIENIKILDPACGSGSFLIKAFEILNNYLREAKNENGADKAFHYIRKFRILNENVYGVDLDPRATEITRLNLLLKSVESRALLPMLTDNIKEGNSLIEGDKTQLKKYFGNEWEIKKPFNWSVEFPDIISKGGFDIIIGNPPYIASFSKDEKQYFFQNYETRDRELDTFFLFIERAMKLLKDGGMLGFIIPNTILLQHNFSKIRKFILDQTKIFKIIDFQMGVFESAVVPTSIIILEKEPIKRKRDKNLIEVLFAVQDFRNKKFRKSVVRQDKFFSTEDFKFNIYSDKSDESILKKIVHKSTPLGEICEIHEGVHSGNIRKKLFVPSKINTKCQKLIQGENIKAYDINWTGQYVIYDPNLIDRNNNEYASLREEWIFTKPKILTRQTADRIIATIDYESYYTDNSLHSSTLKDNQKYDLKYPLVLLNSKLINWVYQNFTQEAGRTFAQVKIINLRKLPIYTINFSDRKEKSKHDEFILLANKILRLHNELKLDVFDNDKTEKLKLEIDRAEKEIDQKVYELYGLNKKEIEIIEKK